MSALLQTLKTRKGRIAIAIAVVFALLVSLFSTAAATPAPPPPADQTIPTTVAHVDPASQALLVIVAKDEVYPGGQEPNPFSSMPAYGDPLTLEFNTFCTVTANSRVGDTVFFSSAQHCTELEMLQEALGFDHSVQQSMRDQEQADSSGIPTDIPSEGPPSSLPMMAEETPDIDPEVELFLYQPVRVPGRYITTPTLVNQVSARPLSNGNDSIVISLNLVDPTVTTPVATVADESPGTDAEVRASGYAGSTMQAATEYMFPQQRDDKKSMLDFLREDTIITPTVTSGTVSGMNNVESSGVTQTNADMTGGMSGGALFNGQGQQVGIVRGGFGGGGGAFNYVSSDLNLLRMDLRAAGAQIPLTANERLAYEQTSV